MRPIMIVAGTRPEVIKLAPVLKWLERSDTEYVLVWSGQHYDYELSKIFFEQLGVPEPDEDLDVGSGSHAEQTARIMIKLEKSIKRRSPAIVVAQGDTNTVAAVSLTALKCRVPFAHVEAGLRSWNMLMPEEINRKIADAIATMHFAPTELAAINLLFEGISPRGVHLTGNTIVDMVYEYADLAKKRGEELLSELGLEKYGYILTTVHRAENTDDHRRLEGIVMALRKLSQHYNILFPVHPRTERRLKELGLTRHLERVKIMRPLGYFEFLGLLAYARTVLTDSGGVQEEAFTLKVPSVVLRYNTERPETTMYGLCKLAGAETDRIVKLALEQADYWEKARSLSFENPLGDGRSGERIAALLRRAVEEGISIREPDLRDAPAVTYVLLESLDGGESRERFIEPIVGFAEDGSPRLPSAGYYRLLARVARSLR